MWDEEDVYIYGWKKPKYDVDYDDRSPLRIYDSSDNYIGYSDNFIAPDDDDIYVHSPKRGNCKGLKYS